MTKQEIRPVETEEISVNDTPITIERQADDTLTVKLPTGLDDTAKEELRKSIETGNVSKLVAAWNRKNQILNEEKAELEKLKADLANPKPKEEKPTQDTGTQPEPLWKRLGLETEVDLEDWAADHPAEYTRALAQDEARKTLEAHTKKVEAEMEAKLAKLKQEQSIQTLTQQIASQGYDPLEVQAFAKMNAITDLSKAFSLYQKLHADKSDPVLRARAEAQTKQINFIEQQHYRVKANPTEAELKNMTDEELKAYYEYAKERLLSE